MAKIRLLLVVVILAGLGALGFALMRGGAPTLGGAEVPAAVGAHKMITVTVDAPVGVGSVKADFIQQGKTYPLGQQALGGHRWFSTGNAPQHVRFSFQAGKLDNAGLTDGPVELVVEATAANLRGSSAKLDRTLNIRSTPPRIAALSTQHYLNQGGCEMVVYTVSASAAQSGVEMAGLFFPGYPVPNATQPTGVDLNALGQEHNRTMFALFAFPYNAPTSSMPHLLARDAAGNQATASFFTKTFAKKFHDSTIEISDAFIQNTVMPIIENTPSIHDQGDPLKNFLLVNRDLRKTDTQELIDAGTRSTPAFLWQGAFTQLANSKVEANFADHRSYRYQGQIVDTEDHLGYDLAAVRHTPVLAANSGKVVWAKYFGIYGNTVLLDHGYGLMSLYAHLNDFQVKAGDDVKKGDLIAHSDSTGLAAGDHLHFSMLLDGVQVNPVEWWDPHWVHDHIEARLQEVAPAAPAPAPATASHF